jgi:hypothetical protein
MALFSLSDTAGLSEDWYGGVNLYLNSGASYKPYFSMYDDNGGLSRSFAGNLIPVVNTWYHFAVTKYSTSATIQNIEVRVNGELIAAAQNWNETDVGGHLLQIGRHPDGNYWDGKIGGVVVSASPLSEREIKAEYQRGLRRMNSGIDTNDTISDNDVAAIAADPNGRYVAVMGDDRKVYTFDEFAVPIATADYPGTTARDVAIKSMSGGADPHLIMAGSDQIEIVQPDPRAF